MLNNIVIATLTYTQRNFKFKFVLRGVCVFEDKKSSWAQASFSVKFYLENDRSHW